MRLPSVASHEPSTELSTLWWAVFVLLYKCGPWGQGKARVQRTREGGFPEKANIPVTARNAFQRKQESDRKKGRPGTLAFVTMSRGAGSYAPFLL